MIGRFYDDKIEEYLKPSKVLLIYGPRRVGKTTLVKSYLRKTSYKYRFETGDDIRFREIIQSESLQHLKEYSEGYDLIAIDEAQRISQIGLGLKILVDHCPNLRIIATGSASFDLAYKLGEPLTGRKLTRILYPIAQLELKFNHNPYDLQEEVSNYLIFGSYPEVLNSTAKTEKIEYLNEITGSYLFKDILELERVKNSQVLLKLIRLLAFQIGKNVSLSELASQVGLDYKTVARYLDLFEKTFVITSLSGFSRNLRKEVTKSKRYYFLDNGIRNAVISNFNSLNLRNDIGALWENFVFIERLKRNEYLRKYANRYFWRTYDRQEIDLIEEKDGMIKGVEFKWSDKNIRSPKLFMDTYPESSFAVIHRKNYLDFVS